MAFGTAYADCAFAALRAACAAVCVALASPATFAQDAQQPDPSQVNPPNQDAPTQTGSSEPGSFEAGRVPVYDLPSDLSDPLKALQREEPKPETLFEARRQAERAAQLAATLLESEGYYRAEVEPFAEGQNEFSRGVRVTPGPRFSYVSRQIEYLDTPPDETTRVELESLLAPLDAGTPARAQPVIETGDAIVARLRQAGYPDASADPVDALADAETSSVELTFRVRPGLRASFGDLRVTGLVLTNPQFIENLRPWSDGERVTPQKLDEFRGRLAETGLFNSAAVSLDGAGAPDANGLVPRDIDVGLRERERFTISVGASASTSEGLGVDGLWEMRNFTGWGDRLRVTGQVATLERRIGVQLSHARTSASTAATCSSPQRSRTSRRTPSIRSGANISATLEEQLTPRLRGSLGVEAGFASILDAQDRAYRRRRPPRCLHPLGHRHGRIHVGVRDILDPHQWHSRPRRRRAGHTPSATPNIVYCTHQRRSVASTPTSAPKDFVGALRGRLGHHCRPQWRTARSPVLRRRRRICARLRIPVRLAARCGTANSSAAAPSLEISAEVRYRARATRSAMSPSSMPARLAPTSSRRSTRLAYGAGVGLRYYTGFGPLRADIAVPLNKQEGDADFQVYISIGQAF
jgi:translocation and assembly module TamA